MKILKLHPLMSVTLFQMQLQKLLHCSALVYAAGHLADNEETLKDVGFVPKDLIEYPIDITLNLREFEDELEDLFNISIELSNNAFKPFTNKYVRLYQVVEANKIEDRSLENVEYILNNWQQQYRNRHLD